MMLIQRRREDFSKDIIRVDKAPPAAEGLVD